MSSCAQGTAFFGESTESFTRLQDEMKQLDGKLDETKKKPTAPKI
tara:strand:+ start:198391 stop:198525 length:135 start_codon:yes stop_codon:yes gene_type:complete